MALKIRIRDHRTGAPDVQDLDRGRRSLCVGVRSRLSVGAITIRLPKHRDERLKQPLFVNRQDLAAPREVRPAQKSQSVYAGIARSRIHADGVRSFALALTLRARQSITVRPGRSPIMRRTAQPSTPGRRSESITDDHGQPLASYELEPSDHRPERGFQSHQAPLVTTTRCAEPRSMRAGIEDRASLSTTASLLSHDRSSLSRRDRPARSSRAVPRSPLQLARGFFLIPEKRIKRKIIEIVISSTQHASTKSRSRDVRHQIPMANAALFCRRIRRGFAAYFGKDVRSSTSRVRISRRHHSAPSYFILPPSGRTSNAATSARFRC